MSNYNSLKATINANIRKNGNQAITGAVMNSVLNAMVNTLGAGYVFAGVATPSTNPGTPDTRVFYLASTAGTYTNFGGITITDGEIAILKWDTAWSKDLTGAASSALITELGRKVSGIDAVSIAGMHFTDNQQWLDGTGRSVASMAGTTGRVAVDPIECAAGDTFVVNLGYLGWQTNFVVTAAVVDEDYNILERFVPATANSFPFSFTITSQSAKYLLLNTTKGGIENYWYYRDNGLIRYLDRDIFRADSFVFNTVQTNVTASFSRSGTNVLVEFSGNPFVFSTGGVVFKLFPADATEFGLNFNALGIYYVDHSVVDGSTYASPVYLAASDIKFMSTSGPIDLNGKIVIAITTNSNLVDSGLLNYGAVGHLFYDGLTSKIPDIIAEMPVGVRRVFPSGIDYGTLLLQKCPKFCAAMRNKNKDVCLVFTGSSLTQGNRYATERQNASELPPALWANDLCGNIFQKLIRMWEGQKYRRYDHADLTYTGTWEETNDVVVNGTHIWDDEAKNGMTKTTTSSGASVQISVPADAWQFNFIYRSDSQGGNCTITIAQGNSKMEVWNGNAWVEANGFVFSMLESAQTSTKGNTCWQKRLKMRCKNKASGGINSIGTAKTLTITKAQDNSRMNVVGFEWSKREFMFTLINGARRNYAWGKWNRSRNLEYFQDTDIWEFKPDLIMAEVTTINWNPSATKDPLEFVNDAKTAYFNEYGTDANSLYEKSNHYQDCEVAFYGDTQWTGASGEWDSQGNAVFMVVSSAATNAPAQYQSDENLGRIQNIFEVWDAVDNYMLTKMEDYIFIPIIREFQKVAETYYGSYRAGLSTSGKDGATLTMDATHWNDNGAALATAIISPLFDILMP